MELVPPEPSGSIPGFVVSVHVLPPDAMIAAGPPCPSATGGARTLVQLHCQLTI